MHNTENISRLDPNYDKCEGRKILRMWTLLWELVWGKLKMKNVWNISLKFEEENNTGQFKDPLFSNKSK